MGFDRTAEHLIIDPDEIDTELVERAGALLADGGLVAIPTETVYGLGCNALDPEAVKKVFAAKQRPFSDPLIVHVDSAAMVELVVADQLSPTAVRLMEQFWPGPLTIVLPRNDSVPDEISGGLDTVAVRLPSHRVAAAIISAAGVPIAAPSANKFSHVSPTSAAHVFADLGQECDAIVDSGRSENGLESTVVAIDGDDVVILRHGAITMESIANALDGTGRVREPNEPGTSTSSPGHAKKHYSPNAPTLAVTQGLVASLDSQALAALRRRGVLFAGYSDSTATLPEGWQFKSLGSLDDLAGVGHDLYDVLRSVDSDEVSLIVLELTGSDGLGRAIDDRMTRAASSIVIDKPDDLVEAVSS